SPCIGSPCARSRAAARPSSCSSDSGSAAGRSSRRSARSSAAEARHARLRTPARAVYAASMPAAARPTSTLVLLVRHGVTPTTGRVLPGRAPFLEMQTRTSDTVRRLAERHRGGAIVAVSHADPIKAVVTQALGAHLDHFQRLVIAPASVTAVAFRAEGTTVLTVNSMDGDLASLAGR